MIREYAKPCHIPIKILKKILQRPGLATGQSICHPKPIAEAGNIYAPYCPLARFTIPSNPYLLRAPSFINTTMATMNFPSLHLKSLLSSPYSASFSSPILMPSSSMLARPVRLYSQRARSMGLSLFRHRSPVVRREANAGVRAMALDGDYSPKRSSSSEPRETILLPGCDYNHWLIVMEFPKDPAPTREQMIDTYLNTLATVVGR